MWFAAEVRGTDEVRWDDVALKGAVEPLGPAAASWVLSAWR